MAPVFTMNDGAGCLEGDGPATKTALRLPKAWSNCQPERPFLLDQQALLPV
jgi:hypothetical protein